MARFLLREFPCDAKDSRGYLPENDHENDAAPGVPHPNPASQSWTD